MIKLDLTSEQLDSLLKTNFCRVDYGKPEPIHAFLSRLFGVQLKAKPQNGKLEL